MKAYKKYNNLIIIVYYSFNLLNSQNPNLNNLKFQLHKHKQNIIFIKKIVFKIKNMKIV